MKIIIFAFILLILGVVLISIYGHWAIAAGIILIFWSHNIEKHWD